MMGEIAVSLREVRKRYGGVAVLDGVTLDVSQGELVCLMGPSGAGKSTILRTINGLTPIDGGTVSVHGTPVVANADTNAPTAELLALRRKVGMVFQQYHLFPHKTVLQNITMPQVHVLSRTRDEAEERAREHLAELGLIDRAGSYPGELSSGQQQRIAIGRALALDPSVLLLDEVTSALDPESKQTVRELISRLGDRGVTRIMVSHEVGWMRENADRVFFTEGGVIVEGGPARRTFDRPRDARTRAFLSALG